MRIKVLFIAISICLCTIAQTQSGYVKTKGRLGNNGQVIKGQRLSGVTVKVKGRNAVVSGNNGSFALSVPGNKFYLQNVQKQGYVMTDPDILSRQYVCSMDSLILVLESQEQQFDDKLEAERKIRRNLQRQLQKREDEIEALKEENKITKQEYQEQLKKIYEEQKSNEKLISDMAERYSRIDYDQLDAFNAQISMYILDGELQKADSLLRTKGDIKSRTEDFLRLQKQNAKDEEEMTIRKKKLEENKELVQRVLTDLARDCFSKFEIFKIQHQNDSAAYYIDNRACLDTMNVEWGIAAGKFYQKYKANYDKAENFYNMCLRNALAEGSDTKVADCYEVFASLYSAKGDLDKALHYYQLNYDSCIRLYGDNHLAMVSSLMNLSNSYRKKGDFDKALEMCDKSVEIAKKVDGLPIAIRVKILGNIANLYSSKNQYQKALDYYMMGKEILDSCRESHPLETITTYNNIGHVYFEMGNYDTALKWDTDTYNLIKSVFGEMHPEMATILSNIGAVYLKQNQLSKALDNMETTLGIDINIYGKHSPNLIIDYNNIGMIQYNMNMNNEALASYKTALALCDKHLPSNHPMYATLYNNAGSVYIKINHEEDEAMPYFEKALKIRIEKFGENSSPVAMVYNNIAKFYQKKGDKTNAIHYFEIAKKIFENTFGIDHPNTKAVQNNIDKIQSQSN